MTKPYLSSLGLGLLLMAATLQALAEGHESRFIDNLDLGLVLENNDNVSRAAYGYQRGDSILTGSVGKSYRIKTGKRTQLAWGWDSSISQYAKYDLLSHARLGIRGAWQYRANGAFGTPTYSLLARLYHDSYRSGLRSGLTYRLGVSAQKSLSDRISVTGILESRQRSAASSVFTTGNTSMRINLDYLLSRQATLYLTYNQLSGDITYSADWVAPYTGYSYDAWATDDAFYAGWRAYRIGGNTQVASLGYNYSFNEKNALDLSFVKASSSVYNGPSYESNVLGVAYLKRL